MTGKGTGKRLSQEDVEQIKKLENHRSALRYRDSQADQRRVAEAQAQVEEAGAQADQSLQALTHLQEALESLHNIYPLAE